jgi:hypothetical protein
MKVRLFGAVLMAAAAMGLSGCASPGASGGPTIIAIYEDVNWYPACATSPIEIGGDLYYPLPMGAPPVDESRYPLPFSEAEPLGIKVVLGLPAVAPPGPGDDIGTVTVYSDGMARFDSGSGNVAWLTREEQEYGYVC